MTAVRPEASRQAVVEAALVLLERMGLTPADLAAGPPARTRVPTFAEYVPVVSAAVSAGTRRAYGSYRNRVIEHWVSGAWMSRRRRRSGQAISLTALRGFVCPLLPRAPLGCWSECWRAGLARLWLLHDRAHFFFSRARWNPDDLGLAVARLVALLVPAGEPVTIAIDDTLVWRRGKRVWAASYFHNGSAQGPAKTGYGNNWVIAAVVVRLPFVNRPVAVPVLAKLVNRVGGGVAPPPPTPPDMRARIRRFVKPSD